MARQQHYREMHPKLRGWGRWLLLAAMACTVALYSIEVTHDHRTAADDLRCPVCHVLGHNALDSAAADLKPALIPALFLYVLIMPALMLLPSRRAFLTPPSRAPPTR